MARRPTEDEPFRVDVGARTHNTKVFIHELAGYLHHGVPAVRAFARKMGLLHWAGRGAAYDSVAYVTEAGAKRIIAHVRALQGAKYMAGKPHHELVEAATAYTRLRNARIAEERNREKQASEVKKSLTLAIPRADTEDEPKRG